MERVTRRGLGAVLYAVLAWTSVHAQAADSEVADHRARDAIIEHVGDRRLVLLGETHGTRETPKLVEALVTHWVQDAPVVLALEMPHGEHAALSAFMASDGGAVAQAALRARLWWQVPDDQHDARRSEDMLGLIDAMRRLRTQGHDVALLAYDAPSDPADRDARDRGMARTVRAAYTALARGRVVMLTGNVHAMLERHASAPAAMAQPAGTWLRDLAPASVRIDAHEGESWGCPYGASRCGPTPASHAPAVSGPAAGAHTFHAVLPRFTVARLVAPVGGAKPVERPALPARRDSR